MAFDDVGEDGRPRMALHTSDQEVALDHAAQVEAERVASYPPGEREHLMKLLLLSWYHRGALDALDAVKQRMVT